MQQSAQQSVTVPPAHPFLHQPFDNVHRLKTMSVLVAQEWQRKYNQQFKVNVSPLLLFFWFLLGFSASSSLCSSLSLQRVIPPFRTLILSFQLEFEGKESVRL